MGQASRALAKNAAPAIAVPVEPRHRPWACCLRGEESRSKPRGSPIVPCARDVFGYLAFPDGPITSADLRERSCHLDSAMLDGDG